MHIDEIKAHLSTPGARWRNNNSPRTILQVERVEERGPVAGILDASGRVSHVCLFEWYYFRDPQCGDIQFL